MNILHLDEFALRDAVAQYAAVYAPFHNGKVESGEFKRERITTERLEKRLLGALGLRAEKKQ